MFNIALANGKVFQAGDQERLLDAAERSGLVLPSSCRTGRCSTCKTKINAGQTVALSDETGLSAQEREEGWILSCVRAACSDVALDLEDLTGVSIPKAQTLPCRIASLDLLAPDVMRIRLRLPPSARFEVLPGQYIDVIGSEGLRRSYSLADYTAQGQLELHVRKVEQGRMSRYWFEQAKVNDLLRLHGPRGTFFLRNTGGQDLVFLATGTGIAPVLYMVQSLQGLSVQDAPRSVRVYWGGRHPEDLYLADPFAYSGVQYVPVLSRADDSWQGPRGYVQQVMLDSDLSLDQTLVYACGSDAMIRSSQKLLTSQGLASQRFFSDAFVVSG